MSDATPWLGCQLAAAQQAGDSAQISSSNPKGHYESWFIRANDPLNPRAIWLRYTLLCSQDGQVALGEAWAMLFDGPAHPPLAVRQAWPLADCRFDGQQVAVELPGARLDDHTAQGYAEQTLAATGSKTSASWNLHWTPRPAPLMLLPEKLYGGGFPKAKSLVLQPNINLHGHIQVIAADGQMRRINLDGWQGSLNHNWGSRHTDAYAWGQVAGFDNDATAFLECATARLKIGPFWTPTFSLAVLRVQGQTYAFNALSRALLNQGRYGASSKGASPKEKTAFAWQITARQQQTRLKIAFTAPQEQFAALYYGNPPGGDKVCLNSKIAACAVTLERRGKPTLRLLSAHAGAFEMLQDQVPSGMQAATQPVMALHR